MNQKKTIIILIFILLVGIVGLTIAYFSNTTSINNLFSTNPYGTTVEEVFTSPSNWLPSTTTDKEITVTNSGQVDEAVRISYSETWKAKDNTILSGLIDQDGNLTSTEENSEHAAIINFSDNDDWTYSNGYYYYNYRLAPNETTSSLIDSVTFNSKTKNSSNCITNTNNGVKTITCNSTQAGYDGAIYTLTFNIETVQYNKYATAWSTDVAIVETKQRMLKGLKVNVADATFDNGDKTAMFEFSHTATEQTPALTDYRYIGHMPNNYVKFNCDNDGTNCEIWRIIGVFSVDDGTGNYEQRIKLVRGSAFAEKMQWDSNNLNEWATANLNIFLNGDYLTRSGAASSYGLKILAQSQIKDVKYYLGGNLYGSAEQTYTRERGIEVYNHNNIERLKSWVGKVALMYPSDEYLVYAKGIDDICYNNPYDCYENHSFYNTLIDNPVAYPTSGWIYNSNIMEKQTELVDSWFLNHYSGYMGGSNNSYLVRYDGRFGDDQVGGINGIRPVVYLKSSINITGGEGTEQNPYTLSNS